ncbi:peptidyl-prolyl cis-trans isomerase FKBP2 isoform X1 [Alligator sinensis]|uniref:peptidylprolyl isomerase n=1 Tax=Alligator sinensis TaxID=38654 RepID=A0A3Q0FSD5_ALLSI|nr:peptidyl-prolyl cis-trans isomerase FKBP2 isoform X1 [Alligator sinensis]
MPPACGGRVEVPPPLGPTVLCHAGGNPPPPYCPWGGNGAATGTAEGLAAMQLWLGLALWLGALGPLLAPGSAGAEGPRKLQIGVKRRVENCGLRSRKGDVLTMHYTGRLEDGSEFDSSLGRAQPFVFSLGTGQVIKGWDQGLLGMCEGEKRKLVIPSELGYGDRGAPPKIPGGATLVFEVELLKIERRPEL